MSNSLNPSIHTAANLDQLSAKAVKTIETNHPYSMIIYANETVHYDGFSQDGPEIEIKEFQIIFIDPSTTNINDEPDSKDIYTYMTYYKEYILASENEPEYEVIQCNYHDELDYRILRHPWTGDDVDYE